MNSMYPKKTNGTKSLPRLSPRPPPPRARAAASRCGARASTARACSPLQPIAEGETIIEYTGEVITWKEAQRRHPHDPDDPNHTFFFHIDDKHVIDGKRRRQCGEVDQPRLRPELRGRRDDDGRVFIKALRDIEPGEELNYDYGLVLEGQQTKKVKKQFACRCGSRKCRGTMLAPKGK